MSTITLHRYPLSGHSHRVELFLSLLGLDADIIDVDLKAGAHKQPEFLAKNSFDMMIMVAASASLVFILANKLYNKFPVQGLQQAILH